MFLRKCRSEDDGTVHAVLIVFVLVVSALAGRQFFMDGTNFIVQSFLDPFWYPGDQETPRRFFAVVWTTAPVRLIGIFFLPNRDCNYRVRYHHVLSNRCFTDHHDNF